MKDRPIIGISTSMIVDKDSMFPGYKRIYVNKDYIDSVIQAGGVPLMLPFCEDKTTILSQAELIDGLILTGGHDVFPHNYGEEPHQKCGEVFPERDEFDYTLLKIAKSKKIPILGICRGMQIINTFEGGTLYQDLSLAQGDILKHWQGSNPTLKTHKVTIDSGSILSEVYPKEIMVNSFHHQILKSVAQGYKVIAQANDGVVEAIFNENYPFLLGVQWHPEMLHAVCEETQKLFELFVKKSVR